MEGDFLRLEFLEAPDLDGLQPAAVLPPPITADLALIPICRIVSAVFYARPHSNSPTKPLAPQHRKSGNAINLPSEEMRLRFEIRTIPMPGLRLAVVSARIRFTAFVH
jgi:hypothetical protein